MNKEELIASFNKDPKSIEWRSKRGTGGWRSYVVDFPYLNELRFLSGVEYRAVPPPSKFLNKLFKRIKLW